MPLPLSSPHIYGPLILTSFTMLFSLCLREESHMSSSLQRETALPDYVEADVDASSVEVLSQDNAQYSLVESSRS
jgi:hypothetical protein